MEVQELKRKEIIVLNIIIALLVMIAAVSPFAEAQVPRDPGGIVSNMDGASYVSAVANNTTYFTHVGAVGVNVPGNPGFLSIMGFDSSGRAYPYYLWIEDEREGTGDNFILKAASYASVSGNVNFPSGDWRKDRFPHGSIIGGPGATGD